jgi:iron complex transport system permease protein
MRSDIEQVKADYRSYVLRKLLFILGCNITVVVAAGLACTIGGRDIGFTDVYGIIYDHIGGAVYERGTTEWWDDYIVWEVRLPRVAMAIIAGSSLAIGGVAMQSMMSNPLANPYTTGISSGACFGAIVAIVMGFSFSSALGQYGIVTNAFLCSLIPALFIIVISGMTRTTPATLILAGIAMSYLFNALNTLVLITAEAESIQAAYLWQVGSLKDAGWGDVPLMLIVTLIGTLFLQLTSRQLNLLTLGDESARSLGMDTSSYRLVCLVALSLMIAAVISYTGIIGFVGLVAPHMVRMIIGADNRYIVPASVAFGAALLLTADMVGRIIVAPGELPVGIIMSFMGGPMFLYLIIRQKKGYGEVY